MADTTDFTTPADVIVPAEALAALSPEGGSPAQQPVQQPGQDDHILALSALRNQLDQITADRDRLSMESREADRRRVEAERQVGMANSRATEATNSADERQLALTETHLASQQEMMTNLKAMQAQALSEGDFAKHSDLNAQMASVAARLENLASAKSYLEAEKQKRASAPTQGAPTQQQPATAPARQGPTINWAQPWLTPVSVEQNIRQFSAPAAAWIRQNPAFFNDMEFRRRAMEISNQAIRAGYKQDSEGFFDYINRGVGAQMPTLAAAPAPQQQYYQPPPQAAAPAVSSAAAQQPGGRMMTPTPAAAPPSSGRPGATSAAGGVSIQLTAEQRKTAHEIMTEDVIGKGKDPEVEYAKHLLKMQQEGADQRWYPQRLS